MIIVENLPVPLDRRVWMEATTLRDAGYTVSVISPTGKGCETLYEEREGVHIYRHELPPEVSSTFGYLREYSAALFAEWRLARRVRRERGFDVVHACNPPDLIFLVAAWFKVMHRTRFLFDHHDLSPELYESKFGKRGVVHRVLRIAERLTFWLADVVISTNDSHKRVATTRGGKREDDVFVVRSAPRLDKFRAVRANEQHKNGRKFLLGYVGIMAEFDGVDHLVRAMQELVVARGRSDVQACLIGSGPSLESLEKLARELGVAAHIEFTGRISDEQKLIELISSCDVGVCPDPLNPYNQNCTMNKILEYMALGKPVVQYDLREGRVSAGGAALYARPNDVVDLADRIEQLLDDPDLRARMGAIGRQRMEESLEWRHQIPSLLRAYERVMPGSKAADRTGGDAR